MTPPRPVDIALDHQNSRRRLIPARVGYDTTLETFTVNFPDRADPTPTTLGTTTFEYPTINALQARLNNDGFTLSLTNPKGPKRIQTGLSETKLLNLEYRVEQQHGDIELIGLAGTDQPRLFLAGPSGLWANVQPKIGGHQLGWGSDPINQRIATAQLIVDHIAHHSQHRTAQALEVAHGWLHDLPSSQDFSASATSIATHLIATEYEPETQLNDRQIDQFRRDVSTNIPSAPTHSLQIR